MSCDVNECDDHSDQCHSSATCKNVQDSYECWCHNRAKNFLGDGWDACSDLSGTSAENAGQHCKDIVTAGKSTGDKMYWVAPEGDLTRSRQVFCYNSFQGGGWVLLLRQANKEYFSDVGVAKATSTTSLTPMDLNLYSILGEVDRFKRADGKWEFLYKTNQDNDKTASNQHLSWIVAVQESSPIDNTYKGKDAKNAVITASSHTVKTVVEGTFGGWVPADDSVGCIHALGSARIDPVVAELVGQVVPFGVWPYNCVRGENLQQGRGSFEYGDTCTLVGRCKFCVCISITLLNSDGTHKCFTFMVMQLIWLEFFVR